MVDDQANIGKPDAKRLELVKRLPKEVLETLSKDEIRAMLQEDEWPDSLKAKLKDFFEEK